MAVVHNGLSKAAEFLKLDGTFSMTNEEAVDTTRENVIASLKGKLWDLQKNMTEDLRLFAFYNEANNHLLEIMSNVSQIVDNWKRNRVTDQFFHTLTVDWPSDRPASLIKPITMYLAPNTNPYDNNSPWNLTFTFMTSIVNTKADLRKVEAFTLYDRNGSIIEGYDWCQIKYIGPPAVTPNGEYCRVEFAKRIEEQVYVGTRCSQGRKYDEVIDINNYELWEKECFKESFKRYNPEAQIKTINDKNYIYCPNHTITFGSEGRGDFTTECPPHVFSLPISTTFALKEVGYRFDGMTEHMNGSSHALEENIQRMIASYIIPNREFVKSIKPINISHPSWLYYAKLILYFGGITITIMIVYLIIKFVWVLFSNINRKIEKTRQKKRKINAVFSYLEEQKKKDGRKVRPSAPPAFQMA